MLSVVEADFLRLAHSFPNSLKKIPLCLDVEQVFSLVALLAFGDRYFFLVGTAGLCSEMLRGIPDLSLREANNNPPHLQIGQPKIPPVKVKCPLGVGGWVGNCP